MSKFLVCSHDGVTSLFLARRLAADGHEVGFYAKEPGAARRVGEGLVPLVRFPAPSDDTTVLFDDVGFGKLGAAYRARGIGCIGGNPFDHELELDRQRGTQLMRDAGITVPETKVYSDVRAARAFLATHSGNWFVKPFDNAGEAMTHNGASAEMLPWLKWAAPSLKKFLLQKAVKGDEISCEAWFDGERFVEPCVLTVEDKRAWDGDRGPRTGCAANVVWTVGLDHPLPRRTVLRLAPWLRSQKYVGPLDLNCIITEEGEVVGLEWTARFGFDALQATCLLWEGDLGEQLRRFAKGSLKRLDIPNDQMALTARVSIPPYPIESPDALARAMGTPLDPTILKDARTHCVADVRAIDGSPVLAGVDGFICTVGAKGAKLGELRPKVLTLCAALKLPEKQYRADLVLRAEGVRDRLKSLKGEGVSSSAATGKSASPSRTARDGSASPSADDHSPAPFVESVPNS